MVAGPENALHCRKSNVHVLPASFTNCSIKQLDVSHNPFTGNAGSYLGQYQLLDLEVWYTASSDLL